MQLLHLPRVLLLVRFQGLIDFLTLVNGVLLVVLDLLVDVLELLLQQAFGLVPEAHHLLEFFVYLLDLIVDSFHFQVVLLSCFVHYLINLKIFLRIL